MNVYTFIYTLSEKTNTILENKKTGWRKIRHPAELVQDKEAADDEECELKLPQANSSTSFSEFGAVSGSSQISNSTTTALLIEELLNGGGLESPYAIPLIANIANTRVKNKIFFITPPCQKLYQIFFFTTTCRVQFLPFYLHYQKNEIHFKYYILKNKF